MPFLLPTRLPSYLLSLLLSFLTFLFLLLRLISSSLIYIVSWIVFLGVLPVCSQLTAIVLCTVMAAWSFLLYANRDTVAVVLVMVAGGLLFAFPFYFFAKSCVQESRDLVNKVQNFVQQNPQFQVVLTDFGNSPYYRGFANYAASWGWEIPPFNPEIVKEKIVEYSSKFSGYFADALGGVLGVISDGVKFLFSIFTFYSLLFYFLKSHHDISLSLADVSPFSSEDNSQLISSLRRSVYNMFAYSLAVGLTHTVSTYLVFAFASVDLCLILSCLAGFAAMLPIFSSWIVLIPVATGLAIAGSSFKAILVISVELALQLVIDPAIFNIIKGNTFLVGMSVAMGLYVYGIMGLILGPLLTSLTLTIFNMYTQYQRLAAHDNSPTNLTRVASVSTHGNMFNYQFGAGTNNGHNSSIPAGLHYPYAPPLTQHGGAGGGCNGADATTSTTTSSSMSSSSRSNNAGGNAIFSPISLPRNLPSCSCSSTFHPSSASSPSSTSSSYTGASKAGAGATSASCTACCSMNGKPCGDSYTTKPPLTDDEIFSHGRSSSSSSSSSGSVASLISPSIRQRTGSSVGGDNGTGKKKGGKKQSRVEQQQQQQQQQGTDLHSLGLDVSGRQYHHHPSCQHYQQQQQQQYRARGNGDDDENDESLSEQIQRGSQEMIAKVSSFLQTVMSPTKATGSDASSSSSSSSSSSPSVATPLASPSAAASAASAASAAAAAVAASASALLSTPRFGSRNTHATGGKDKDS